MRKLKLKKKYKIILVFLVLIAIGAFSSNDSYARYFYSYDENDVARVARYGELSLIENTNGTVEAIGDNLSIKTIDITKKVLDGSNINESVKMSFLNGEVSSYLFFVVDSSGWSYDDGAKNISVLNNGSKVLYFNIDDSLTYLKKETISSDGLTDRYIFYYDYDVKTEDKIDIEVFNTIYLNIVCEGDISLVNDSKLNFKVYSVQKNEGLDVEDAWNIVSE